jgi:hypothetical protein
VYGNVGACLGLYGVRAVYKMCVQDRVGAGLRVWGKGDKRRWRETQRESEVRGRRSGSVARESTNAKGKKLQLVIGRAWGHAPRFLRAPTGRERSGC